MVILLTEKTGYTVLINTEFMVCATTARAGAKPLPEDTVVTLMDGNSIVVQEAPDEILALMDGDLLAVEYEAVQDEELEDNQPLTIVRKIEEIPPK